MELGGVAQPRRVGFRNNIARLGQDTGHSIGGDTPIPVSAAARISATATGEFGRQHDKTSFGGKTTVIVRFDWGTSHRNNTFSQIILLHPVAGATLLSTAVHPGGSATSERHSIPMSHRPMPPLLFRLAFLLAAWFLPGLSPAQGPVIRHGDYQLDDPAFGGCSTPLPFCLRGVYEQHRRLAQSG